MVVNVAMLSSAILDAAHDPLGASRQLLRLGKAGALNLVIPDAVAFELSEVVSEAFGTDLHDRVMVDELDLETAPGTGGSTEVHFAARYVERSETSLYVQVVRLQVQYVVTLDEQQADLLRSGKGPAAAFEVVTPDELVAILEKAWLG